MEMLQKLIDELGPTKVTDQINSARPSLRPISYQAVKKWAKEGVPADRVIQVVLAFPDRFTLHALRPDIYPFPEWRLPGDYCWPELVCDAA